MRFRTPEDIPEDWEGEPTINNPKMAYIDYYTGSGNDCLAMTYRGKQYIVPGTFIASIIGEFGDPEWELCGRNYYVQVLHPQSDEIKELVDYDRVDWEKLADRYDSTTTCWMPNEKPLSSIYWVYIRRIDRKGGRIDFNGEFAYCYCGREYTLSNVFLGNLIGRWNYPNEIECRHLHAQTKDPLTDVNRLISLSSVEEYTNADLLPSTAV